MKKILLSSAVKTIQERDDILILTHQFPDGDTLGSGFALCGALQLLGKKARVACSDEIPKKYEYLTKGIADQAFAPKLIMAVDVASAALLGEELSQYASRVELSIDHHKSNTMFAQHTYVDVKAAATAEIIYEILVMLGVNFTLDIATCLYTALATDTGCFKYSNVTPKTLRIAALMMSLGVPCAQINRTMFDTKSRARMEIERELIERLEYHFDGRCALIVITEDMLTRAGADEGDIEGLSPLPRQIEGVTVGLTFRERSDGSWKVSVRTGSEVDGAALCAKFGGGGHRQAAGCTLSGDLDTVKARILAPVAELFGV